MKKKIVIAGGSGFIGQYLQRRFEADNYEVKIVSRKNGDAIWSNHSSLINVLEGTDMLINLAGKPIDCRFTAENKKELIDSRVQTTKALGEAILDCKQPPKIWFNASGAHIYGTADEQAHNEGSAMDTHFFPAIMAKEWEDALYHFDLKSTRQIALRIAIVLGKDGGVLQPYIQLTKFLLGGKQGSGKQIFSWIHLADFYQILHFVYEHKEINGAINLCSPEPIPNEVLMKTLRKEMHKPFGIPAPAFGIKIGAALMGIEPDLILKSLYVLPTKLLKEGYQFKFATIQAAIKDVVG